MLLHVLRQISCHHLVADVAHIRLLLGVLLHVVEELVERRERLITHGAVRRVVLGVRPEMGRQVVFLIEAFVAERAFWENWDMTLMRSFEEIILTERALAGMCANVGLQVVALTEAFSTNLKFRLQFFRFSEYSTVLLGIRAAFHLCEFSCESRDCSIG